ncbi:hypothetical protein CBL_13970 [Carabus blaptoides fortunei]
MGTENSHSVIPWIQQCSLVGAQALERSGSSLGAASTAASIPSNFHMRFSTLLGKHRQAARAMALPLMADGDSMSPKSKRWNRNINHPHYLLKHQDLSVSMPSLEPCKRHRYKKYARTVGTQTTSQHHIHPESSISKKGSNFIL